VQPADRECQSWTKHGERVKISHEQQVDVSGEFENQEGYYNHQLDDEVGEDEHPIFSPGRSSIENGVFLQNQHVFIHDYAISLLSN
jgi:hypothetical protein